MEWTFEVISFLIGLFGGATIGSLVTIRVVRDSSIKNNHSVSQSGVSAGRDNAGGNITKN
jgi:hypothetical protein